MSPPCAEALRSNHNSPAKKGAAGNTSIRMTPAQSRSPGNRSTIQVRRQNATGPRFRATGSWRAHPSSYTPSATINWQQTDPCEASFTFFHILLFCPGLLYTDFDFNPFLPSSPDRHRQPPYHPASAGVVLRLSRCRTLDLRYGDMLFFTAPPSMEPDSTRPVRQHRRTLFCVLHPNQQVPLVSPFCAHHVVHVLCLCGLPLRHNG